jgi:hypothetical protein
LSCLFDSLLQGRFLLQESHLVSFVLAWRIFDPDGIGRIPLCKFRHLCEVSNTEYDVGVIVSKEQVSQALGLNLIMSIDCHISVCHHCHVLSYSE